MDITGEVLPGSTVVVVTGGDPPDRAGASLVPPGARVVAADSGADTAMSLGLAIDEVVGDLDSLSPTGLAALQAADVPIEVHDPDKDATDLELALLRALRHSPSQILVLGGLGGRVDHELANLLLLTGDAVAGCDVVLRSGTCSVRVVRPGRRTTTHGSPGELVSLMAMRGLACGVTTTGLRWPLVDADLAIGTTLGVSNELLGSEASVTCTGGVLLVVQPGTAAATIPTRSSTHSAVSEVPHDR